MRYGTSVGPWSVSNVMDITRRLARDFSGLTYYPYRHSLPLPRHVIRDLRAFRDDKNLTFIVHGPIWDVNPGSVVAGVRVAAAEQLYHAIDFASMIDADLITLHTAPAIWPEVWPWYEQDTMRYFQEVLTAVVKYGDQAGVRVTLENMLGTGSHYRGFVDFTGISPLLDMLSTLGVTYDTGHSHVADLPQDDIIRRLGPRVLHVHATDNHGETDEHLAPGDGLINWQAFCQALLDIDYQGIIEFEVEHNVNLRARDYTEKVFASLRDKHSTHGKRDRQPEPNKRR